MKTLLCFRDLGCDFCWPKHGDNRIGAMMNGRTELYHEKQVKELCALHALNNLFQESGAFTKEELDEICHNLSPNNWINPHKSLLGLGNYDINVIMAALQTKNYECIWFDKRKDPNCLNLTNIEGFILNVPSDYKFGFVLLPLRRKHWVAIREIRGSYYNLDSKLDTPEVIGKAGEVIAYLREQLESKEKELFIVVTHEVEQSQNWKKETVNATHNNSLAPVTKCEDLEMDCEQISENHVNAENMFNTINLTSLPDQSETFENRTMKSPLIRKEDDT